MKHIRWHYLLLIPAIIIPLGAIYGLWIQDGGILNWGLPNIWIVLAVAICLWGISMGCLLLGLIGQLDKDFDKTQSQPE